FSFVSEGANIAAGFRDKEHEVRVQNPLTTDQAVMRRSLVPGLIQNVAHNLNQSVGAIRLFEIGRTYRWKDAEDSPDADPQTLEPATDEKTWLCAALCGREKPDWRTPEREFDFF